MYQGVVSVAQDKLESFLAAANELKIKGLINKEKDKNVSENAIPEIMNTNRLSLQDMNNIPAQMSQSTQQFHLIPPKLSQPANWMDFPLDIVKNPHRKNSLQNFNSRQEQLMIGHQTEIKEELTDMNIAIQNDATNSATNDNEKSQISWTFFKNSQGKIF